MKNKRWLLAQADNYYGTHNYLFLFSRKKTSGNVVWDLAGGEWELDGVGHMSFRLELLW